MNTDDPSGAGNAPPPAAPAGVTPRRMYRDPHGPIGGVASGFAAYFDIDPVITRLLFVVALLSGIGLPAYILCWLVIPKAKSWPPADAPSGSGASRSSTTLLSGLVIVALAAWIGAGVDGLGQYVLPAALIGFGVFLLNRRPEPAAGAAPANGPPADGAAGLSGSSSGAPSGGVAEPAGPPVTAVVLSVLGIGAGVLLALDAAGLVSISVAALAGGALVVVGAGLLASLWLGPAPRLVPIGLGLAGIMLASSAIGGWFDAADRSGERFAQGPASGGGVGDQTITPRTLSELEPRYDHGAGKLTVDLGALDFTGEERELEIDLGFGELLVLVPDGAAVEVEGGVGMGRAELFGHSSEGFGVQLRQSEPGSGQGSLRLDLDVGFGEAEVRHVGR